MKRISGKSIVWSPRRFSLADVLSLVNRSRAAQGFATLLKAYPEPMKASEFQDGLGYAGADFAIELRKDWRRLGIISADDSRRPIPVALTEGGREVAKLALELERMVPGFLDRPRAARALLAIHDTDPDPAAPATIRHATAYGPEGARDLRSDLERFRLVAVEQGLVNNVRYVHIRLTALGRRVAALLLRLRKAIEACDAQG